MPPVRRVERGGRHVEIEHRRRDGRLATRIAYLDTGSVDTFDWELVPLDELARRAEAAGMRPALTCTRYDPTAAPSPEDPAVQVVFTRA